MLKVKIECRNVGCEKIANCLVKFGDCPYKVWLYNDNVFAFFMVDSLSSLKKLTKRLKQMKNVEIKCHRIELVKESWLRRILGLNQSKN
jgi:hypothetical protein